MNHSKMSLTDLKKEAIYLAECRAEIDADIKSIEQEILNRMGDEFYAALKDRGQEYGDCTMERDGVKLTLKIAKTVTWDSDKLSAVAAQTPPELRHIYKAKISVSEKDWNAVKELPIGQSLLEARIVKYGEPKVSFKD
jgi:hypothetical protein